MTLEWFQDYVIQMILIFRISVEEYYDTGFKIMDIICLNFSLIKNELNDKRRLVGLDFSYLWKIEDSYKSLCNYN